MSRQMCPEKAGREHVTGAGCIHHLAYRHRRKVTALPQMIRGNTMSAALNHHNRASRAENTKRAIERAGSREPLCFRRVRKNNVRLAEHVAHLLVPMLLPAKVDR